MTTYITIYESDNITAELKKSSTGFEIWLHISGNALILDGTNQSLSEALDKLTEALHGTSYTELAKTHDELVADNLRLEQKVSDLSNDLL